MTDQVPLGVEEITQGVTFSGKLLDTILAEDAQSGFIGFTDSLRWKGLAHRHEGDFFGIASGRAGCLVNALANSSNVLCNGHSWMKNELRTGQSSTKRWVDIGTIG